MRLAATLLYGLPRQGWARVLEAKYANYFEVGSNDEEFFLQFGQSLGIEGQSPMIHTRLVTTPAIASEIARILGASVERHQQQQQQQQDAPPGLPRSAGDR